MKTQYENITVITGASGGIGKAFVKHCAGLGHRLILLDKNEDELLRLAIWLKKNFDVQVHPFAIDIASPAELVAVTDFLNEHHFKIDWLINNAGNGHVALFKESKLGDIQSELNVNVLGTTLLTHELLPFMNSERKSYLLFMSSLACFYPLPLKNTYGASKAFITNLASALRFELAEENISVSVCCPGPVNSTVGQHLADKRLSWQEQLLVEDPEVIVEAAIAGMLHGRKIIIPNFFNKLLFRVLSMMPRWLKARLTNQQFINKRKLVQEKPLIPGLPDMQWPLH
jgi:short-subunit dehydrogenase